ncbi:MAG TPA: enoyl-CoA hydratase-related protein [Solimonas sp.]|nr:enoyl-CoA hydratase-related protein [Solimonas sp.]
MAYQTLRSAHAEGVTVITLARPDKLNALSRQLLRELREALQQAADDAACRCVVLTGEGRGFCAGADLGDPESMPKPGQSFDFGAALDEAYHPLLRLIRGMAKPVIAAVNGSAAGAGCNIALAADLVIATRSARFMQAFVRIGLVPDAGGTWTIPRLVGRARATQWMMSGEAIDADTAARWGLIAEVCDDAAFEAQWRALAQRLAQQPTVALAGIKRLVDAAADNSFEAQIALEATTQSAVGRSHDTMEGITAFMQKRPARFAGR